MLVIVRHFLKLRVQVLGRGVIRFLIYLKFTKGRVKSERLEKRRRLLIAGRLRVAGLLGRLL